MGETQYLAQVQHEFLKKHPQAEGWQIRRICPDAYNGLIRYLPAFLRTKHPKAPRQEKIVVDAAFTSDRKGYRRMLTEMPTRRRGQGIVEDEWYGEIDFEWRGEPVHFLRRTVTVEARETRRTWIAFKTISALESLWIELRKWESSLAGRGYIYSIPEGLIRRPKVDWKDLILPAGMVEDIRSGIEAFLSAKNEYRRLNLPYRRGFLFVGAPGGGKTMTTKVIASKVKASVYLLPLKADMDDSQVRLAFRMASANSPAVLILEDLDRLRDTGKVSMSYLLNLLDGMDTQEGVIVLATTNAPEKLDSALLHRPSRFDRVWHFPLPGFDERLALLRKKALGRFTEAALEQAAAVTQGFTMAYVQEAAVNAMLAAVGAGRVPTDADLAASVDRLKGQQKECHRADSSLKPATSVGFSLVKNSDNGSRAGEAGR